PGAEGPGGPPGPLARRSCEARLEPSTDPLVDGGAPARRKMVVQRTLVQSVLEGVAGNEHSVRPLAVPQIVEPAWHAAQTMAHRLHALSRRAEARGDGRR